MAVNIGPKIGIDGEKEYRKQINDLITQQKTFSAELRELESSFDSEASAMDKNRKKSELLEKSIENQEKAVEELEKGLEESKKKFGENSTQTQKWKQSVSNAKTELNKMRTELSKVPKPLSEIGKSITSAGKKMQKVGDTMTKYVTAPLTAIGAASIAAFNEVDEGMDIITKATGATGEALTALQNSAKSIATTIPTSFETAGSAVGAVNTKFGVTGTELETLSTKFVKFAELNDTDVSSSVAGVQKVMAAFGVDTKDAGKVLDAMNKTGQDTGISMDSLQTSMVKNAAALKDMGLDAYQAAAFLGSVETSGADTSVVMSGLSKALINAGEDGKTLPQALSDFQTIMNSTATEQEKLTAATELFGKKAGAAIYEACSTGSLSFESLASDAGEYLGSVETTFDNVIDPADEFTVTMNSLKVLGSEVGKSLIQSAAPAIKQVGDKVKDAADWFGDLDENQQMFAVNIAASLALGAPALSAIGRLTSAIGGVVTKIGEWSSIPTSITTLIGNPVGVAALAVAGLGIAFNLLDKDVGYVNESVQGVVTNTNTVVSALDEATGSLSETLTTAQTEIGEINENADFANGLIDELAELESQTNLTAEQQGRMRTIVSELNALYPDFGLQIDSSTGKLNKSAKEMREYVEQTRKIKLAEAFSKAATKGYEDLAEAHIALSNAQKQQGENQEVINGLLSEQARLNSLVEDENGNLVDSTGEFVMVAGELDAALMQNANDLMFAEEKQKELTTATDDAQEAYDNAKTTIAEYETAASETAEELSSLSESTDENTTATEDNTEATDASKAALKEWATDLAGNAKTAASELFNAATAWNDLYNATKDSIDKQMGLFDEWEQDSEVTIDSMIENLDSQIKGMQSYSSNMSKLSAAAAKSSDPNFKAVVKSIAEMGVDGAAYADALVTAMDTDQAKFNEYLSMIGGEGSREEAQTNLAGVLTYVQNDFKTGMESGMEGASAAITKVFGDENIKTGMKNFGNLVMGAVENNKKLEASAKQTGKSAETAFKNAGSTLTSTSKSSTDTAKNYTETEINGMDLRPDVDEVKVPQTVTQMAKDVITSGVSNVHGKVSAVDGTSEAGKAAKTKLEGKINSLSGKVTKVSVANDTLTNVKSAIQNFFNNNPISAKIRGKVHAEEKAYGGFVEKETLTFIAEQNKPEVVIPLDPAKRARAMSLYQQTGQRLGVATQRTETFSIAAPGESNSTTTVRFDESRLYAAVAEGAKAGIASNPTQIFLNNREVGRVLHEMGVSFA